MARSAHILLALGLAAACGQEPDPHRLRELSELAAHRALWRAQAPANYALVTRQMYYGINADIPTQVIVLDAQVNRVVTPETRGFRVDGPYSEAQLLFPGEQVPDWLANIQGRSVPQLFALIDSALHSDIGQVHVAYDSAYGFPSCILFDHMPEAIDDEWRLMVDDFTSLPDAYAPVLPERETLRLQAQDSFLGRWELERFDMRGRDLVGLLDIYKTANAGALLGMFHTAKDQDTLHVKNPYPIAAEGDRIRVDGRLLQAMRLPYREFFHASITEGRLWFWGTERGADAGAITGRRTHAPATEP